MKKFILAFLLAYVAVFAPWRLIALAVEVIALDPTTTRMDRGNDRFWDVADLTANLERLGWEITYVKNLNYQGTELLGLTLPSQHKILIEESLTWNGRLHVLAHEGGHTQQPAWVFGEDAEAFAESVGAVVSRNGLREHARFLARSRPSFFFTTLAEWPAIYRAAAVLSN